MQKSVFGRTGLEVSRLTFGCGAVGGLMTRGDSTDQDNAVAWARDNGINFFDTAASYGNGASETNLGRALNGNTDGIIVSTKVGLIDADLGDIAGAVRRSIDASLTRLKLDHVDLFQLHNTIGRPDRHGTLSADQVLHDVVPAFDKLREAGKTRFIGFTAKGDPQQLCQLVESDAFDSAQIFYNLLVPSAGEVVPAGYPAEDYRCLLNLAEQHGVGAIGVRVLAGGALSGTEARHPLGMAEVAPIGSDTDYATDVRRALQFQSLVDAGYAASLPELAIRYAVSNPVLPTTEIGIATRQELESAAQAVNKGPLPAPALEQIRQIQSSLVSVA
ncbi:MAG: aldo/keto reductase [Burkholderiaceae bacterium]